MAVNHSETYFEEINFVEPTNSSFAEQFTNVIGLYYTPALVALGSLGNLLSIYVFFRSKLRLQSTSQYLSALAISDTVFLCQLLVPWLKAMEITDLFHRSGFCQAFVYTSYVSCSLSSWLVVAFTIERFVAVIYPLQRNVICSVKRARHIILGITALAMSLNIPLLRFAKPTDNDCSVDQEYMTYAARFNLIDTIVTFSVPLTIIIFLNVWIMVGVCRLDRARRQLMKAEQSANIQLGQLPGGRARPRRLLGCPRSQQRVTRMLLIVSSVFVVLNLPAYIMRMMAYANNGAISGESVPSGRWSALQQVSHMLFNTNFGINFILYCLSGQNFRRAIRQTIPCIRRRARRGAAVRRVTSHPARASSISTSFVSNGTEATTNFGMPLATPVSSRRRRRGEPFISRWTFDNTRQRQVRLNSRVPPDQIEMRAYPGSTEI